VNREIVRASLSKAFAELGVGSRGFRQNLDRDVAIQTGVAGFVDRALPAGIERRDDVIRSQLRSRAQHVNLRIRRSAESLALRRAVILASRSVERSFLQRRRPVEHDDGENDRGVDGWRIDEESPAVAAGT
jgi:hypothetical protein